MHHFVSTKIHICFFFYCFQITTTVLHRLGTAHSLTISAITVRHYVTPKQSSWCFARKWQAVIKVLSPLRQPYVWTGPSTSTCSRLMETATGKPSMCIWIYVMMMTSEASCNDITGRVKTRGPGGNNEDKRDKWKWPELMIIALFWRQMAKWLQTESRRCAERQRLSAGVCLILCVCNHLYVHNVAAWISLPFSISLQPCPIVRLTGGKNKTEKCSRRCFAVCMRGYGWNQSEIKTFFSKKSNGWFSLTLFPSCAKLK